MLIIQQKICSLLHCEWSNTKPLLLGHYFSVNYKVKIYFIFKAVYLNGDTERKLCQHFGYSGPQRKLEDFFNVISPQFKKRNHDFILFYLYLMFGSCHFDRASIDEFSVECLFRFFQPTWKSDLKVVQITKNDLFWVDAPL